MPSNNFKVFDENAQNIMSDANYNASTQRQDGVGNGIADATLHNKLFRQASIMTYAIAELMKAQGLEVSDADIPTLVSQVASTLVTADELSSGLAGKQNALGFTPTQLALSGTSNIPTTGWVANTGDNALKCNLAIAGVLATDWAEITIDKDYQDTARDAEINSTVTEYANGVTVYANTAPAVAIPIRYRVVR